MGEGLTAGFADGSGFVPTFTTLTGRAEADAAGLLEGVPAGFWTVAGCAVTGAIDGAGAEADAGAEAVAGGGADALTTGGGADALGSADGRTFFASALVDAGGGGPAPFVGVEGPLRIPSVNAAASAAIATPATTILPTPRLPSPRSSTTTAPPPSLRARTFAAAGSDGSGVGWFTVAASSVGVGARFDVDGSEGDGVGTRRSPDESLIAPPEGGRLT